MGELHSLLYLVLLSVCACVLSGLMHCSLAAHPNSPLDKVCLTILHKVKCKKSCHSFIQSEVLSGWSGSLLLPKNFLRFITYNRRKVSIALFHPISIYCYSVFYSLWKSPCKLHQRCRLTLNWVSSSNIIDFPAPLRFLKLITFTRIYEEFRYLTLPVVSGRFSTEE